MTTSDPFDALYSPVTAVAPDAEFAERLRNRLQDKVFAINQGETMTSTVTTGAITPYIGVNPAAEAIRWYIDVFGATQEGESYVMDDGRIGHAELIINGARLMLADEFPEMNLRAPQKGQPFSSSLHLRVSNVDDQFGKAIAAGATVEREPGDQAYGRVGAFIDPFGHRWMLNGPAA